MAVPAAPAHTPGPWSVVSFPGIKICGTFIIEPWSKKELAAVNAYDRRNPPAKRTPPNFDDGHMQPALVAERDANVALIGAAPEMVEALEWISEVAWKNYEQDRKLRADGARSLKRIAECADAALAKARRTA